MSYGELTSIRVSGTDFERTYRLERAAPAVPADRLDRFAGYAPTHADWHTRHTEVAALLDHQRSGAESVIIICELLADDHYDDEKYVVLHEEEIVSELRETAFRHFEREIHDEMAAWLEHHRDPDDVHLEQVMSTYEQRSLKILEEESREWELPFDRKAIAEPRRRTRRERRYRLPKPFDHWDSRNSYQQYFFLEQPMTFAQSGSGGSSQRANHSVFGLAFALHDATQPVRTHILVYDAHNRLIEVDTLDRLCLVGLDLGSNYDLPWTEVKSIVERVLRCDWDWEGSLRSRAPVA